MKDYKVIIVNGSPQAGKDTFIDLLAKSGRYKVIKTSIIDPIKNITKMLHLDTSNKTIKDRKLWADLIKCTMDYNEYPITKTIEHVNNELKNMVNNDNKPVIVCIIARNPDNIETFKHIFRDNYIRVSTVFINNTEKEQNIPDNTEDQSIFDYVYDLYIENNHSLKDLEETIEFIDWIEI